MGSCHQSLLFIAWQLHRRGNRIHFSLTDPECGPVALIETDVSPLLLFAETLEMEPADSMELPPLQDLATTMQFKYHSNAQMNSILKKTEEHCPDIARTYSIGRSMEGRELLVIEFSNNPGQHELRE